VDILKTIKLYDSSDIHTWKCSLNIIMETVISLQSMSLLLSSSLLWHRFLWLTAVTLSTELQQVLQCIRNIYVHLLSCILQYTYDSSLVISRW